MGRYWRYGKIISLILVVMLASCAGTEQVYVSEDDAGQPSQAEIGSTTPEAVTESGTLVESETVRLERLRIEEARERQREEAAATRAAAQQARLAEIARAEQEAEQAAEAEQVRAAAEAIRQQELARVRAEEEAEALAQELVRQQAQVDELRAQVTANNEETANLEAANSTLQDAVRAAENLSAAMSAEQQKYSQTDPVTGETLEALERETLEALSREIEQLKAQAASLISASE